MFKFYNHYYHDRRETQHKGFILSLTPSSSPSRGSVCVVRVRLPRLIRGNRTSVLSFLKMFQSTEARTRQTAYASTISSLLLRHRNSLVLFPLISKWRIFINFGKGLAQINHSTRLRDIVSYRIMSCRVVSHRIAGPFHAEQNECVQNLPAAFHSRQSFSPHNMMRIRCHRIRYDMIHK